MQNSLEAKWRLHTPRMQMSSTAKEGHLGYFP